MRTREWTRYFPDEKATWGEGPWMGEPDKVQWLDPRTGLPCLAVRNQVGSWCGYVGVTEDHPYFGVDYNECSLPGANPPNRKRLLKRLRAGRWGHGWIVTSTPDAAPHVDGLYDASARLIESELFLSRRVHQRSCGDEWCKHQPEALMPVHGGLTFSGGCQEGGQEATTVCHVPDPGEPTNVWWFGFDCAHAWDRTPLMDSKLKKMGHPRYSEDRTYRDLAYVRSECAGLAVQLMEARRDS